MGILVARETITKNVAPSHSATFCAHRVEDHDEDPAFLDAQHHSNAEGWLFYNRALDDFFAGRGPKELSGAGRWSITLIRRLAMLLPFLRD